MVNEPVLDAVIVGGGASGAFVARLLFDRGLSVLVLEAGKRYPSPDGSAEWESGRERHFEVDPEIWKYEADFEWARVRALGGRTLVWGGWSSRPTAATFEDAALAGVPFPFALTELEPFFPVVEGMLGVGEEPVSPAFVPILRGLGLAVEGKRTARSRGRPTSGVDLLDGIAVETNAIVTRVLDGGVELQGGRVVRARNVVLAASAIETARILLESGVTAGVTSGVGTGLVDHMVASYLLLDRPTSSSPEAAASALIPRFVHRDREYVGGFVTEVIGPHPGSALSVDQRKILEIDDRGARALSFFTIHSMGPTMPSPNSRVRLSDVRDAIGRRIPHVETAVGDNERSMARDMEETCVAIADALAATGATVVPFAEPLSSRAGHEAGTCRMGADPAAPVDPDGRLRGGMKNVWVVDASILPLALDVHPTVTLLAIAARTAAHIR